MTRARRWTPILLTALASFAIAEEPKPKGEGAKDAKGDAAAEEDDDLPSQDLRAEKDEKKRYFLIGPRKGVKAPKAGWRLLVVLPGGGGGADFHRFVKNIRRQALSDEWIVAQPVAVKWREDQQIVWPTKVNAVPDAEFTTEEFVFAVVGDVAKALPVDPNHVFTMSWSSSGPAAYAISLTEKTPVTGSYVAMSVFVPAKLPPLDRAKGHPYFLDHSPQDETCRFEFAEEARETLTKKGAKVELVTYEGGHGWHGDLWGRIRKGIAWLEENHAKPPRRAK